MNVIMFSSLFSNRALRRRVPSIIGDNTTIGHIPASYLDVGGSISRYDGSVFTSMGFKRGFRCPIGYHYDEAMAKRLEGCGGIYIGGGNTFELMFMLRARGLDKMLRDYVHNGGLLMGSSAGGIVMGQTVEIASFADDNYLALRGDELRGIGLVDFDVKPHWDMWEKRRYMFEGFVEKSKRDLYGLKEGQAIHVHDDNISYLGGCPDYIGHGS